jgi:hypothetical protein
MAKKKKGEKILNITGHKGNKTINKTKTLNNLVRRKRGKHKLIK